MKTEKWGSCLYRPLLLAFFLSFFTGLAAAADIESLEIIDRLLSLSKPVAPEIIDDAVIFTWSSNCRRAGVAFANEGFSQVHWLRQLLIPLDPLEALLSTNKKNAELYKDSGILFYIHKIPDDLQELEYRLVVDGLWIADPGNPMSRRNAGLEYSILTLPVKQKKPEILQGPPGTLSFSFKGPPGETVSVAGSFNGWDPFMYQLKESPAGNYTWTLPLPPGKYQYIFFHRGERYLDPNNPNRAYSREGLAVSEVVLP